MTIDPSIFKAYDIRGTHPDQINKDVAYAIGASLATYLRPRSVAVGRDMRLSSDELFDGLSRAQFERALGNRRMPFLRRLMAREGYQVETLYSGLPSSTPGVQGELFYGVKTAVPAFAFVYTTGNSIWCSSAPRSMNSS